MAIVTVVVMLMVSVSAHPGRTDSNGGHHNRSTGEYHYHHGYPEHQHTGGECPYSFDNQTGKNSGGGGGQTKKESKTTEAVTENTKVETPTWMKVIHGFGILSGIWFAVIFVVSMFEFFIWTIWSIVDAIRKRRKRKK